MPNANEPSQLVAAAAALDDELRALDDLARAASRHTLNCDKALGRTARALTESVTYQERIEEKLRAVVQAIEAARQRQQASIEALVTVARELERRTHARDALLARFGAMGASATQVNALTAELSARKESGAQPGEVLERLHEIEDHLGRVVTESQAIVRAAEEDDWPEIARQAEAVRQQVHATKNKLALAHRDVASQAPS